MKRYQTALIEPRSPRKTKLDRQRVTRAIVSRLALVGLAAMSMLGLGGCRAVEAIFKVGVWFGVLIVVAIVAVVGGIAATVMKKR